MRESLLIDRETKFIKVTVNF